MTDVDRQFVQSVNGHFAIFLTAHTRIDTSGVAGDASVVAINFFGPAGAGRNRCDGIRGRIDLTKSSAII